MGHHFYTIDKAEGDRAEQDAEFKFEGPAAFVFPDQQPGTVPLLRSFNGGVGDGGDHFYTTDPAEQDRAAENGWDKEGVACFVFAQPQPGAVPLLRFFNDSITDHFYTIDPAGENAESHGWAPEGISCFVFNHQRPGTVELRRYFRRGEDLIDLGTALEIIEGIIVVVSKLGSSSDRRET